MSEVMTLRVAGRARMDARADSALLSVAVSRSAATPGRARAAASRTVASLEQVLARHPHLVLEQDRTLVEVAASDPGTAEAAGEGRDDARYRARATVTALVCVVPGLEPLLVTLGRRDGVSVAPLSYRLRDPDRVRGWARKAAVADATAAARAIAESLGGEVSSLNWISEAEAPHPPTGPRQQLRVEHQVFAQFTATAPPVERHPG